MMPGLVIEGIVEDVNFLDSSVRAPTGEQDSIPNGEIRVVRNFSRGAFSGLKIHITINAEDLPHTLITLNDLGESTASQLPELLEPWQAINTANHLGQNGELTLVAKALYGASARLKPRLLKIIQQRLHAEGIRLGN
jgi:hypothetical protein